MKHQILTINNMSIITPFQLVKGLRLFFNFPLKIIIIKLLSCLS